MFENLSEKFSNAFKKLTGRGKLTEDNISEVLREVRLALLEADVNYKVVKDFVADVKEKAIGQDVMQSLTPGQQFIKIVNEDLTSLMGQKNEVLDFTGRPPFGIMLVGLQGSGKTTTAGKLANFLKGIGRHPYLVPADIYRPAAIDQLKRLGDQLNVAVHNTNPNDKPEYICLEALQKCGEVQADVIIFDTAGRLHVDESLMVELERIKGMVRPREILLVADAMTGQDAVNVAREFDSRLDISGVILTKTEGDARGGAALSIKAVTGKPIKFIGVGEQLNQLESFHPDRMASQILGMGDILSLIEKAQKEFDEKDAKKLAKKIKERKFDLEDFRDQLQQIKKIGSMDEILSMIPGMSKLKQVKNVSVDEKELVRVEAIINSMTPDERHRHKIINGSRRKRIAVGSGTSVQDVNRLLKNFEQTKKMMERFTKNGSKGLSSMFR